MLTKLTQSLQAMAANIDAKNKEEYTRTEARISQATEAIKHHEDFAGALEEMLARVPKDHPAAIEARRRLAGALQDISELKQELAELKRELEEVKKRL